MDYSERTLAIVSHVSYLFLGIGFLIVPAIIYLVFRNSNPFIANHAKRAVEMQMTVLILGISALILNIFTLGAALFSVIILFLAVCFVWIALSVVAAYYALIREDFDYSFF